MMKKSTFGAALAFLAAATGALTAAAIYLRRREKELDEYEQLLFSDEYDEDSEVDPDLETLDGVEEQPQAAEEAAEPEAAAEAEE